MQDPVTEGGDLGAGQPGLVGESDEPGPGDQIGGSQDDFEPGGVSPEAVTRQVAQPGGLQFADTVFVIPTSG